MSKALVIVLTTLAFAGCGQEQEPIPDIEFRKILGGFPKSKRDDNNGNVVSVVTIDGAEYLIVETFRGIAITPKIK